MLSSCPSVCHTTPVHQSTRKLSYRKDDRAMRPIYGSSEKFRESSQTHPATFPEICNVLRSILSMCVQNLKFVALPVPEIIGGTEKNSPVPGYAHAPFSPKFWRAFVWMDPVNIPAKFKVRTFIRSWDNRGTEKIWTVPGYAHAPFSPKFFMGLFSDGLCECISQICSP